MLVYRYLYSTSISQCVVLICMVSGLCVDHCVDQFVDCCIAVHVQLRQSQLELQEVRVSHRHLSARFEEFTEERSLQGLSPHPASLLCEIEQSMEQEEQEQEREQVHACTRTHAHALTHILLCEIEWHTESPRYHIRDS